MKIVCETFIESRNNPRALKDRVKNATIAIGFHTIKRSDGENFKELEIIHFTPKNKFGTRYKVFENIEKIFNRFVGEGKATVCFRDPPVNIQIKSEVLQLKSLLHIINLGIKGEEIPSLKTNIHGCLPILKKSLPVLNMCVTRRSAYPLKGFPRTLEVLEVSGIALHKITFSIYSLRNLTSLNLQDNKISEVPLEVGRLKLQVFNLSKNMLHEAKSWKWLQNSNIRESLCELNLSDNRLENFPTGITKCEKLVNLDLQKNLIKELPFGISRLHNLRTIYLNSNLLRSLPASIQDMTMEMLNLADNDFRLSISHKEYVKTVLRAPSSPESLFILASRAVVHLRMPLSNATVPWCVVDMIKELPRCGCGNLCFGKKVLKAAISPCFHTIGTVFLTQILPIFLDVVICGRKCRTIRRLQ